MSDYKNPSEANNAIATRHDATEPVAARKRLNLDLSEAAFNLLQELAEQTGKTKVEVLRTGLALYGIANDAKKKGQVIAVAENDEVVKEIVIS
jgi:hypothetical protein